MGNQILIPILILIGFKSDILAAAKVFVEIFVVKVEAVVEELAALLVSETDAALRAIVSEVYRWIDINKY